MLSDEKSRRATLLGKIRETAFGGERGIEALGYVVIPIEIAGVRIDFLTRSIPVFQMLADYFEYYLSEGPATCQVWIEASDLDIWEDPDPEFLVEGDCAVQRDFAARRQGSRAVVLMPVNQLDSIHNFLRWMMPTLLLERGAFLLHGAGVVHAGEGYAFFGQRGAGKSTTVAMIMSGDAEAEPIGDDAVIVEMCSERGPMLHSAPLGCGYSRTAPQPASVPLKGLYALAQSSRDQAEPLSASEGVAALVASAMNVHLEDSVEERLSLALEFARSPTGIARLHLRKSPEFWSLIRAEEAKL